MGTRRTLYILALASILAVGCGRPLRIITDNRVDVPMPVQANVIAQIAPDTDDGPVVPMFVAGSGALRPRRCARRYRWHHRERQRRRPVRRRRQSGGHVSEKVAAVERDARVAAVVVRINSPGGGVAASQTMRHELESFRQRTGLPVVACLMDVGAGGAYYVATASDVIYAQPGTVTGGIGVIFNAYNLQDMMAQFNIVGQMVKSGENIDVGTPIKRLSPESQDPATDFRRVPRPIPRRCAWPRGRFRNRSMTQRSTAASSPRCKHSIAAWSTASARWRMPSRRPMLANRPGAGVVMYRRKGHPAYSIYATTPHVPLQATISLSTFRAWTAVACRRSFIVATRADVGKAQRQLTPSLSKPLEVLDVALMFFGRRAGAEGARFRRLPVLGFFFREYKRYSPDASLRILARPPLEE